MFLSEDTFSFTFLSKNKKKKKKKKKQKNKKKQADDSYQPESYTMLEILEDTDDPNVDVDLSTGAGDDYPLAFNKKEGGINRFEYELLYIAFFWEEEG